jgi:hypothetical protein
MTSLLNMPTIAGLGAASTMTARVPGELSASATVSELREGFRQGFVFEIYDTKARKNIPNGVHVMVLNPVRYTLTEPFQRTLTPGEDNQVVREENGIIVRDITLEGTFGLKPKSARGFLGAQGGGKPLTGTQHFSELRRLFRQYSVLKKDPDRAPHIAMIFHALRDDDHFIVVPKSFETPRDAQKSRVHYEYRITLEAVEDTHLTLTRIQEQSATKFMDKLRTINEAFHDARAAFADITADLAQTRRRLGNLHALVGNAAQFINAVGNFVSGAAALINFPPQLAANLVEQFADAGDRLLDAGEEATYGVAMEWARNFHRMEAAVDRILLFPDRFREISGNIGDLFGGERNITQQDVRDSGVSGTPQSGGATVGSRTRVVSGSGRMAGLDLPERTGIRGVVVQRTDTIESIAADADTAPEVVIIMNDLRPPYITEFGGPGIAKPGDKILVPSTHTEPEEGGRESLDYLGPDEALYGVDIAIDDRLLSDEGKLDIAIDEAHGSMDAALRKGVHNVVQGTEITLHTERGATVFLPNIGIRRNAGTKGTIQHVLLSSIILREALLSDRRVVGIESSSVVLDKDELRQEITPILTNQRPSAPLVLPFGRPSSGE